MFGKSFLSLAVLLSLGAAPAAKPIERPGATRDIAGACGERDGWSDPAPPAHIHGKSWYVGTCGITVVLIETSAGLVLIDTGPADAAPTVLANIRKLGFDPGKIAWILNTHPHFDHAGGIEAIRSATGAKVFAGPFAGRTLRTGVPDAGDPQFTLLKDHPMHPAQITLSLETNEEASFKTGDLLITARSTPVHMAGSTSWTWQSCEAGKCLTIAYVDSISTISADDYRFSDHPDRVIAALSGLRTIKSLPCDIMLTPHPGGSDLLERLSGKEALVNPNACEDYAASGMKGLNDRLAKEAAPK